MPFFSKWFYLTNRKWHLCQTPDGKTIARFIVDMKAAVQYLAGGIILVIGLYTIFRRGFAARGLDAIVEFGPLLFAIPMAVFGAFHFLFPAVVAPLVPGWIPGHMFWVYFVGVALIAAALSLAADKVSTLAATLLGVMILSFVLLISVPGVWAHPENRFNWILTLRDMSFSVAAFALALSRKRTSSFFGYLAAVLRSAVAVAMIFFAVQHFLHPQFVPAVPLRQPLPTWFPLHSLVNYVVGGALFVAGVCMLLNVRARSAATGMGTFVLAVILLVYLPLLIAAPLDVAQVNYFFDTMTYAGTLLLMASLAAKQAGRTNAQDLLSHASAAVADLSGQS